MFNFPNSVFSNNSSTTASSSEQSPEDIPKEELMQLCMKLNKRMQAMETKGKELVKKKNNLLQERKKLLHIINVAVGSNITTADDQDLDFELTERSWSNWITSQRDQVIDLETKLLNTQQALKDKEIMINNQSDLIKFEDSNRLTQPAYVEELQNVKKEKDDLIRSFQDIRNKLMKSESEIERLKQVEIYLKEQQQTLENVINDKNTEIEKLNKELDQGKLKYEEKVLFFQMQINNMKTKEDEKNNDFNELKKKFNDMKNKYEEKEMAVKHDKEMINSLQNRLLDIEPEYEQMKEKITEFEKFRNASSLLKVEQESLMGSLKKDLKTSLENNEKLLKDIKTLENKGIHLEAQLVKMQNLQDQVNKLSEELEDKTSSLTRARSEAQTHERNHAMRTAMLATCEAQLEEIKKTIVEKDNILADNLKKTENIEEKLKKIENEANEKQVLSDKRVIDLENELKKDKDKYSQKLKEMEKNHLEMVEIIKKDFAKKSTMARNLLSDREEEVKVLNSRIQELQHEIRSGAPSERRIFEMAQQQARREAMHGAHSDSREIAFQELQKKLATRDFELASAQQQFSVLQSEVSELRRAKQREGINMDYLKNIVIQYMSFPLQSSEKLSLVPVIAMLLQFNAKELADVTRANKDPTWGTRAPKEVKRIYPVVPPTTAAQSKPSKIGVSSSNAQSFQATLSRNNSASSNNNYNGKGLAPSHVISSDETDKALNYINSRTSSMSSSDRDIGNKLERMNSEMLNFSATFDEADLSEHDLSYSKDNHNISAILEINEENTGNDENDKYIEKKDVVSYTI